jgi:hypothetical protein
VGKKMMKFRRIGLAREMLGHLWMRGGCILIVLLFLASPSIAKDSIFEQFLDKSDVPSFVSDYFENSPLVKASQYRSEGSLHFIAIKDSCAPDEECVILVLSETAEKYKFIGLYSNFLSKTVATDFGGRRLSVPEDICSVFYDGICIFQK